MNAAAPKKSRRINRIATRVRNMSLILLVLVLVSTFVLATVMVTGISGRASEELAFFY